MIGAETAEILRLDMMTRTRCSCFHFAIYTREAESIDQDEM